MKPAVVDAHEINEVERDQPMKGWGRKSEFPAVVEVARAASEGLPRPELLRKTLLALAGDGRADRIGVWLESADMSGTEELDGYAATTFRGVVWDRESENLPAEWRCLSPQAPLPQELLTAGHSVEFDQDTLPMIGPLLELRRALLVPVGRPGRLRGVLLAGSRHKHAEIPAGLFESAASELALAMKLDEEHQLSAARQADLWVVKHMLADMSATREPGQILADLVDSCTLSPASGNGLGAIFAAIGCLPEGRGIARHGIQGREIDGAAQSLDFLWKSEDQVWSNTLESPTSAVIWRRALAERRLTTGNSGTPLPRSRTPRHSPRAPARAFLHIVAIPLEYDGRPGGVLVAGLAPETASPAMVERLELRAALAATALGSWKRHNEEMRLAAWKKSLLDNYEQATVLLDEEGGITAMSAATCRLLGEQPEEHPREHPREYRKAATARGAQHFDALVSGLRPAAYCRLVRSRSLRNRRPARRSA
ncbi:MAG: hypothetical protein M3P45_15285 [Acidobacteriota bacterium]|nr:hypothetical protein [Acidobacteriota bacterium]